MILSKPRLRKSPITGWWSCRRERDEFNGFGPTAGSAYNLWERLYPRTSRLLREATITNRSSDKS